MRLLVTGGAGFIGSNFVRAHLAAHAEDRVVNADALTYAGDRASLDDVEEAYPGRYRFVRADIADGPAMRELLATERPGVIVNFAAESHNSRAVLGPDLFVRTNVLGTQVLLEEARRAGIERFHHVSTCEVYGDVALDSPVRFTEDHPYRPNTPYSASKASADLLVRAYWRTYGLPVTISNSSNNYGPFQYPEKMIPLFITSALEGRPLPLYRQSANKREWLHVSDTCRAIGSILERGAIGETYNVGSGDERTIEEVATAIVRALGAPESLLTYVPDRPGHDRRYPLDHAKIERELGWRPEVPFEEGLRSTIDWYRANRAWWAPKRAATLDESSWQDRVTSAGVTSPRD